jgi:hypothetical protein
MLVERFWPNIGDNQWFPVTVPYRSHQTAVHPSDELEGYLLRTHRFTLAMIRTTAKCSLAIATTMLRVPWSRWG